MNNEQLRTQILTYRPTSPVAAPLAANYSLSTIHYSLIYAFSAKERDVETVLSYFGARYYSSDLSIWLSVDPMSDKYPSLSPYVYCANNPVKLVDPNGEEVDVSAIYQKNVDGSYKYKSVVKAFEFFARTKYGKAILSQYAKKGQNIAGVEYEEDGNFHQQRIDLSIISNDNEIPNYADGIESYVFDNKRMNITINLSNISSESGGVGNVLEALCHEIFIHSYQDAVDYSDDGYMNHSQLSKHYRTYKKSGCSTNDCQHGQDASNNGLMKNYALPILKAYYDGTPGSQKDEGPIVGLIKGGIYPCKIR